MLQYARQQHEQNAVAVSVSRTRPKPVPAKPVTNRDRMLEFAKRGACAQPFSLSRAPFLPWSLPLVLRTA